MRRHFHRCPNLRVLSVAASELSGDRGHGQVILEELCAAKRLEPCLGLLECDELADAQKRELLVARAAQLRHEEGSPPPFSGPRERRSAELAELRAELAARREAIAARVRELAAEGAFVTRTGRRRAEKLRSDELRAAGLRTHPAGGWDEAALSQLDALDRGLERLRGGDLRDCAACSRPIEIERLRRAPDTLVCAECAARAPAEGG
jgi:RNA polymerase-binding transcription factor DksA